MHCYCIEEAKKNVKGFLDITFTEFKKGIAMAGFRPVPDEEVRTRYDDDMRCQRLP